MSYRDRIAAIAGKGVDPRHVEAYMRLEHATLDSLSADEFDFEVKFCVTCVCTGGERAAEDLARSFGL